LTWPILVLYTGNEHKRYPPFDEHPSSALLAGCLAGFSIFAGQSKARFLFQVN
jgi:hypothetical protein